MRLPPRSGIQRCAADDLHRPYRRRARHSLRLGIDGISQATPLDTFKTSLHAGHSVEQMLQLPVYGGVLAGLGWQWVNIAWLAACSCCGRKRSAGIFRSASSLAWPVRHPGLGFFAAKPGLAADAFALRRDHAGAFFILTDPVTASTTNRGRLIFGALAGLLVWLIRSFGGYPDGVAFAVLLANITVPLIDYTRPRVYGHR
jgi:electron transport complex protein RnfD